VYVAFANPNDFKACADRGPPPFGPNMMAFRSPENLMKNLPKAMANIGKAMGGGGGFPTDSPTFKITIRDYEDMAIKVGDKVTIELRRQIPVGFRNQFNSLDSLQCYALRCI
jgi:hypothetical protein